MKSIATGVAAVAAVGAAAVGVASIAAVPASLHVRTVAVGAPLPQDPPPAPASSASLPTAAELSALMNSLVDPSVSFTNKSNLIEGGIAGWQAGMADKRLQKAAENGDLPLTFNFVNIQPGAPDSATADVVITSPKRPSPVTQNMTFINQGNWILSRSSAIQAVKLLRANGE
jgi:hypothetical protein